MENAHKVPDNVKLFVNIVPGMIRDGNFRNELEETLRRFSVNYDKLIFELTEREDISDIEVFCALAADYRENGWAGASATPFTPRSLSAQSWTPAS